MKKFTRRSYNRKLIVFGLSLFMAISLVTVGFAAWVMSAVTNAQGNAPVKVAVLSDASMTVTIDQLDENNDWTGNVIHFDASKEDTTGRLRSSVDGEGNSNSKEQMEMDISGKVTHAEMLSDLTMDIVLPNGLANAIENGYIIYIGDDGETGTGDIVYNDDTNTITVKKAKLNVSETATDESGISYVTFSFTLEFNWSSYFGGVNPSEFYDNDALMAATDRCDVVKATGAAAADGETNDYISDAKMKQEMEAFHGMLIDSLLWKEADGSYDGSIVIIVKASA